MIFNYIQINSPVPYVVSHPPASSLDRDREKKPITFYDVNLSTNQLIIEMYDRPEASRLLHCQSMIKRLLFCLNDHLKKSYPFSKTMPEIQKLIMFFEIFGIIHFSSSVKLTRKFVQPQAQMIYFFLIMDNFK